MTDKKPSLDAAYALQTPDDNRALYADWAESYDKSFVSDMDYQMPAHVAAVFAAAWPRYCAVLDVGAGTGALGEALCELDLRIDALDLSAEMLHVADRKGVYRNTIVGDLTKQLEIADQSYGALISSGTFTHGHVGPDALDELLRIAKPGALFVLGINAEHFESRGFADKFAALEPVIRDLALHDFAIYGTNADKDHQNDRAFVAAFYKI